MITIGNPDNFQQKSVEENIITPDGKEPERSFKAFVTKDFVTVCFEEIVISETLIVWDIPLVIETAVEKDPITKEIKSTQFFKPFVPLSKGMRIRACSYEHFLCEVVDEKMQDAYYRTVQGIKAQMSGIITPNKSQIIT